MPMYFHQAIQPVGEIGVWDIREDEDFFLDRLELSTSEREDLGKTSGRKRVEWLAVRYLLHVMSGRAYRTPCKKDQYGKPYLADSHFQISMSHTHGMAAVIASEWVVGVDIQKKVAKIDRIKHKFISTVEAGQFDTHRIDLLHILWGAKESLYKAYGRRKLDFKEHIHIEMEPFASGLNQSIGQVSKGEIFMPFKVYARWIPGSFCLVYAIQDMDL